MAGSGDVPALVEDRLRPVCLWLPGAYEELAWTGIRWRVRGRTFAHACTVEADNRTSHARVFATDGPVCVVTFRARRRGRSAEHTDPRKVGPRQFRSTPKHEVGRNVKHLLGLENDHDK